MSRWALGVRKRVADNYELLVAGALLVGLLGGFLAYTAYVEPGTTTETRDVSSWESAGEFSHRATVVNGTAAFDEGAVLDDRTVYFREITPELHGSFAYSYQASDSGNLTVGTTVSVQFQSVQESEDGGTTVFWRDSRVLDENRQTSVRPADRVTTTFRTNVSAMAEELRRIDDQHGGTPGQLEVAIVAETAIAGTRNGESVDVTRDYRLQITTDDSVYRVEDPGVVTESGSQTREVTVQATPGLLYRAGGPLLIVLSVALLAGLGYGRWAGRFVLSDAERAWLAYRSERSEFDEWITTGTVETSARGPTTVETDTLAGLVDVAIDTDSRVVEDTETDAFFVFTDDQRFRYDPPSAPSTTSTDRQASDIDPLAAGPGDGTADHTDQKSGEKSEPDPDEHCSAGESTEE